MNPIRAVARTLVPAGVKDRMKVWPWRACDLAWTLRSGLSIRLDTRSEWLVYNDIFVDGEYDRPIAEAFQGARGRAARFLDLGANLGFFAVRVGDLAWRAGREGGGAGAAPQFHVTGVEGSPRNFAELTQRIGASGLNPASVRLVHGLAGQRTGSAVIHESAHMNGMNSILTRDGAGTPVPFVDLDELVPAGTEIDLLKCDIEGAELSFVENYPDLLKRTRRAVFELHPTLCDVEKVRRVLAGNGLSRCEHLWDRPDTFTDYFTRG